GRKSPRRKWPPRPRWRHGVARRPAQLVARLGMGLVELVEDCCAHSLDLRALLVARRRMRRADGEKADQGKSEYELFHGLHLFMVLGFPVTSEAKRRSAENGSRSYYPSCPPPRWHPEGRQAVS